MNKFKIKFGLPAEVKFCKKCVISNQRPITLVETKHTKEQKKKKLRILIIKVYATLVIGQTLKRK
jgi:hypothetical protein